MRIILTDIGLNVILKTHLNFKELIFVYYNRRVFMESVKSKKPSIISIFFSTANTFKKNPSVYIPFLIFAALEFLALMLLFLAPREPFRSVLGPPIRAFWGEQFLHYPVNFMLLPKLASHSRMVLSVFAGSILTGIAVARYYSKKAGVAWNKYVSLMLVVIILNSLFYFLGKFTGLGLMKYFSAGHAKLLFIPARFWLGLGSAVINLLIALVLQSALVYAIPALMLKEGKFLKSLGSSLVFFKRHFFATLILVGLPMLIYLPILVLYSNTAVLIYKFFPESILVVSVASIVMSSLVIDPLVTIATASVYLSENKEGS